MDYLNDIKKKNDFKKLFGVKLKVVNFSYHSFAIPKANQGWRIIETPNKMLKQLQRQLSLHLHYNYKNYCPTNVHSYIKKDVYGYRRNIVSNARAHLFKKHMLNLDLKDFFHQISPAKMLPIIKKKMTKQKYAINAITKLCFYNDRLPMGAPTSPILSNIAAFNLDKKLKRICNNYQVTYTRYVDDLTFSSPYQFPVKFITELKNIIQACGFYINRKKTTYFGPKQDKVVTGIVLSGNRMAVKKDLLQVIKKNIKEYGKMLKSKNYSLSYNIDETANALRSIKQTITGQINFVKMIEGVSSENFIALQNYYNKKAKHQVIIETFYI